jgi:hypothetical protein
MRTWSDFASLPRAGPTDAAIVRGQHSSFRILVVSLAGCLFIAAANDAAGQTNASSFGRNGVRHVISASVGVDPAHQATTYGGERRLALTLSVRISDHAVESEFYGQVPVTFSDFTAKQPPPERMIWEDGRCHQERGLPKMAVTEIKGEIKNGEEPSNAISARARHIGLMLPSDEVMAGTRLGRDQIGPFMAIRTHTSRSHLIVDLKLYILGCNRSP